MNSKKLKRIVFVVALASLLILVLLHLASFFIEYKISKKMSQLDIENFSCDKIDVSILQRSISFKSLSLSFLSGEDSVTIDSDSISVSEINIIKYLFSKDLYVGSLAADSIHLSFKKSIEKGEQKELRKKKTSNKIPKIFFDKIQVTNGKFESYKKNTLSSKTNFFILAHAISITDKIKLEESDLILKLNNTKIAAPQYHMTSIKNTLLDTKKESLICDSILVRSKYKKYRLSRVLNKEIDWIKADLNKIEVAGINYQKLLSDSVLNISNINISSLNALFFRDKRLPFKNGKKLMPHEFMQKIKLPFSIDTVRCKDFYIKYQEFVKESFGPGEINFNHLYATAYNISNIDSCEAKTNYIATLDAKTNIMGKYPLSATFTFPLPHNKNFTYEAHATLSHTDMQAFNPMLVYVALMKIKNGNIKKMKMDFSYNSAHSTGTMELEYENLKIAAIDKDTKKSEGLGKKIKTLFSNILIKDANLKGNSQMFRVGKISFERNQRKSLFNYWWESTLSGFKSSTGIKKPFTRIDYD